MNFPCQKKVKNDFQNSVSCISFTIWLNGSKSHFHNQKHKFLKFKRENLCKTLNFENHFLILTEFEVLVLPASIFLIRKIRTSVIIPR